MGWQDSLGFFQVWDFKIYSVRLHVAKSLTGFILCATTCNRVCELKQHSVTSNNVGMANFVTPVSAWATCKRTQQQNWELLRPCWQQWYMCKHMHQLPTMLGPTAHRGKDANHETLKTNLACVMRVRGLNNFERVVQTDPILLHYPSVITEVKTLTDFWASTLNNTHQHATGCANRLNQCDVNNVAYVCTLHGALKSLWYGLF